MKRDKKHFEAAFLSGHENTKRFLMSRGLSRDDAIEVAQAAWGRAWEKIDQLRDPSSVCAWVNTIAINLFRRDHVREARSVELEEISTHLNLDLAIDVELVLANCNRCDAALLRSHYLDGLDAPELGHLMGKRAAAIRVNLHRARKRLCEQITISTVNHVDTRVVRTSKTLPLKEVHTLNSIIAVGCYVIGVTEVEFAKLPSTDSTKMLVAYFMRQGGVELEEIASACAISEDEARVAVLIADMKIGASSSLKSYFDELVGLLSE